MDEELEKKFQARYEKEQKEREAKFQSRYTAESDATTVPGSQESVSLGEQVFPETTQMLGGTYSGRGGGSVSGMEFLSKPVMDLLGLGTRALGSVTGQGEMIDPESNIWGGARQRLRDYVDAGLKSDSVLQAEIQEKYKDGHWSDSLPMNDPYKFMLDPRNKSKSSSLKALRNAGEMLFEAIGDPFVVGGIVKAMAKQAGKSSLKGVGKQSLEQGGFKLTPAQASEEGLLKSAREVRETQAQANPFTQKFAKDIQEDNLKTLEGKISGASEGMGGKTVEGVESGVSRGGEIQRVAEDVEDTAGKLYKKGEDVVTKPAKQARLIGTEKTKKNMVESGLLDEFGKPLMKEESIKTFKSNATKKMDELLKEAGYVGGEVTETKKIGSETIKAALEYKQDIAKAKTLDELINAKRNIGNKIFKGRKDGVFVGDKNQKFLERINSKLNQVVEETVSSTFPFPKKDKEAFINAYKTINEQYSKVRKVMEQPTKTLKLGKPTFNSAKVTDAIQSIPADKLKELKDLSKTDLSVRSFYNELQRGGFENLIMKSRTKGDLSPAKFKTQWSNMRPETKKALFQDDFIKDVDSFMDNYDKTRSGDLATLNPSGTAKTSQILNMATMAVNHPMAALKAVLNYHGLKHYYRTGKSVNESALNFMAEGGRKIDKSLDKVYVDKAGKVMAIADIYKSLTREKKDK